MNNSFIELMKKRRTIYALGKNVSLSQDKIVELIKSAVKESPSAFNSQTSRVVILFEDSHNKLWDIVKDELRSRVNDEDAWEKTEAKVESFKAAFGTALFFEDQSVIRGLQEKMPTYANKFPIWGEHGHGIAAHNVWAALANEEIGASLQHYDPIIDEQVAEAFDIPKDWILHAQMPFGSIEAPAGDKSYMDDNERFRVYK